MSCAASRWSARGYLRHWQPSLFPPYFDSLLHPFFASLLPLDTDARVEAVRRVFPEVRADRAACQGSSQGSDQTWGHCNLVCEHGHLQLICCRSEGSARKDQAGLQVQKWEDRILLFVACKGLRCLSCSALLCRYELLLRRR